MRFWRRIQVLKSILHAMEDVTSKGLFFSFVMCWNPRYNGDDSRSNAAQITRPRKRRGDFLFHRQTWLLQAKFTGMRSPFKTKTLNDFTDMSSNEAKRSAQRNSYGL